MRKSILFFNLCLILVLNNSSYSFLIPIFPEIMIKKGISLSMIGLIISVFTIGSVSVSIYLSKHLSKFNYQKIIIISQISLLISSLTFMILKKIDKNWVFK